MTAAIDDDNFIVAQLCEQRAQHLREGAFFVESRDNDRNHTGTSYSHGGRNFRTSCAQAVGSSAIDSNRSLNPSTIHLIRRPNL
jgi:hypothetical protein